MGGCWAIVAGFASALAPAGLGGPSSLPPSDFKVVVESFGSGKGRVLAEELVAIDGRVYQFSTDPREVVVIDPARARVVLLDLGRRVQAEIPFRALDESLGRLRVSLLGEVQKREKMAGRANAVEAEMLRGLAEPRLSASHEPGSRRVRLTSPTVEVDASGEPEADAPAWPSSAGRWRRSPGSGPSGRRTTSRRSSSSTPSRP